MKPPTETQLRELVHQFVQTKTPQKVVVPPPSPSNNPPTDQKVELAANIKSLEAKLKSLEALIQKKEAALTHGEGVAKSMAHVQRAVKAHNKPKTAVQDIRLQRATAQAKKSNAPSGPKNSSSKKLSIDELKALATRVRGQIAVAKQKLAAL